MSEIKSWAFWRAVAAEFVGMLLFIFIGLSAITGKDATGSLEKIAQEKIAQELKVALAFALAIATLAQSLGHVSGAHLNPAISLGLLVSCQISALRCLCYILAQMLGAVAASAIVSGYSKKGSLGVNALNVSKGQGFIIEFLATLQLVLCVIAVTDKRRSDVTGSAPLAIGLSVGLGHFAAVYWLGPMCGGIAAALIYDFLLYPRTQTFSRRRDVLLHGPEDQSDAVEIIGEGNSSPGPSQWPKH
ncbi:Aquaporin-1 [Larimichthys crocea]|uniref:Aquaporin-1 n=1 Tax=Larimichthys crocea TaxID=215358 RepID=A0A6G0IHM0_LARCR|nr:Aquaporin-1 [Larimichthys crocea]